MWQTMMRATEELLASRPLLVKLPIFGLSASKLIKPPGLCSILVELDQDLNSLRSLIALVHKMFV